MSLLRYNGNTIYTKNFNPGRSHNIEIADFLAKLGLKIHFFDADVGSISAAHSSLGILPEKRRLDA